MDTSEEYVRMCEGAEEIQELWQPNIDNYKGAMKLFKTERVWLPRQDQLQEMVKDIGLPCRSIVDLIYNFADFAHDEVDVHDNKSMEQLWLAFVMKEKYNKQWDDNEWKAVKDEKANASKALKEEEWKN